MKMVDGTYRKIRDVFVVNSRQSQLTIENEETGSTEKRKKISSLLD